MVKIVINDVKNGKSYQKEFELDLFIGKKIGDKVAGDILGLKDYDFEITGGSDSAGFPLSKSFESMIRKKILVKNPKRKGCRVRKSFRGNYIGDYMAQINMKVVKYGSVDLVKGLSIEVKIPEEIKQPEKKEEKSVEKKEEAKPVKQPKVEEKKK